MRRLALLLWLLPAAALAQSSPNFVTGQIPTAAQWNSYFAKKADATSGTLNNATLNTPTLQGLVGGTFTLGGVVTLAGGSTINNLTLGGTTIVTAPFSMASGAVGTPSYAFTSDATTGMYLPASGQIGLAAGGVLTADYGKTNAGAWTFDKPADFPNQTGAATLSVTGNAVTSLSGAVPCMYLCVSSGFVGGTISGGTQTFFSHLRYQDVVLSTSSASPEAFFLEHDIAPNNGNSASGGRITFSVLQNIIGTDNGATYTQPSINQAAQFSLWVRSNEGGTSSNPQGSHTVMGVDCEFRSSNATNVQFCAGGENDLTAVTGVTYDNMAQWNFVHLGNNAVLGRLGPDLGLVWAEQTAATIIGYKCILCLGNPHSGNFPSQANGAIIAAFPNLGQTPTLSAAFDTSQVTYDGCVSREPNSVTCNVKAVGITGAARLTTDGNSASSYIYQTSMTNHGSSYATVPAITAPCGATLSADLVAGGTISQVGINNPGSSCAAEATATIASSGGTTATVALIMAGNTLNFPINSTVNVACTVAATSLSHSGSDAIGWHIQFGATMGATASTTAIVGSPSWTQDYATASAASHIGISAPSADTSLGAVNITITPTSGTWDVGGRCQMTKSAQT